MKSISQNIILVLFVCGVFGVDADEVKTVTVMEGDSVTLNTNLTDIDKYWQIVWRFDTELIAEIDGGKSSCKDVPDGRFRGRLQLDSKTTSLTITNMRMKHSGLYEQEAASSSIGTTRKKFRVAVYESPSVIDASKAEKKSHVSVMVGGPLTLQTNVTKLHGDELIVWRFGDEGKLLAKHDIEAKSPQLYNTDERFRDRLKLDEKTGSLTITNTRTTDSELYTVKISSNKQTLYKRFNVNVNAPGLSSGAVAGIVIVVLLVFAAGGVIFYRRKISEQERQMLKTVPVMEGDSVTLNTDVTEIHRDDLIEWRFGDKESLIAVIRGGIPEIYDTGVDERFLDRLELDKKTGSLIIMNTRNTDTGLYELKISQDSKIKYKKFSVSVCVNTVSMFEGEPVTLKADTEIQRDDLIQWRFGDEGLLIAEIRGGIISTYDDVAGGIFKGRLKLDKKTGSLIITNTEMKHDGVYRLQITFIREVTDKTCSFIVDLKKRNISVREGNNLILNPKTEIQKDDQIQWMFGDQGILITEIRGGIRETNYSADERFRDRLKLDANTGSLIITDMRTEHTGDYKLQINRNRGNTIKRFVVTVYLRNITVEDGKDVTVNPKTEIQKDDLIQWRFGDQDILIAETRGWTEPGTRETHDDVADGRFRGRLTLNAKTGSLIITNMRNEQSGDYKLLISSSRGTTNMRFVVTVYGETLSKCEGETFVLKPDTKIQSDALIQWRFGNRGFLIATIRGGIISIYDDVAGVRFRGRLKLHMTTGSLIIRNTETTDTGEYKLKIKSKSGVSYKTFSVYVRQIVNQSTTALDQLEAEYENDAPIIRNQTDSSGKRVNESATVDMPLLNRGSGWRE